MNDQRHRIVVITGDHGIPDPTKPGARYTDEDLKAHKIMSDAFAGMTDLDIEIWNDHERLLDGLRERRPDLVVNFCDTGFRNVATQELVIPSYLELLGIPYTGAPPAAMVLAYDKQIVRLAAEALGVPVPREVLLPGANADDLPGFHPALIKPNKADGSVGITKDAVVHDDAEAAAYLAWIRETLPGVDALYQEFLPGTEYGVALIGNPGDGLRALPIMEVDYSKLSRDLSPILSYESKTDPASPYWTDISYAKAAIGDDLADQLEGHAARLFARFGLRDYGRFDFRCDADGVPKLMEVNPNPAWDYAAKMAFMSEFSGLSYDQMLRLIVDTALARVGLQAP